MEAPGPNTVRLTFLPENKTFEFEHGKLPYQDHGKPESILDVAMNFGLHLEHACGGNCACTTCHVVVKKGKDCLSDMDDDEADRLDMAAELRWDDAEDIGIALAEKYPDVDPLTVRYTDLHRFVTELPTFVDDPKASNEGKLEAIQMAWHEEYQDRNQ